MTLCQPLAWSAARQHQWCAAVQQGPLAICSVKKGPFPPTFHPTNPGAAASWPGCFRERVDRAPQSGSCRSHRVTSVHSYLMNSVSDMKHWARAVQCECCPRKLIERQKRHRACSICAVASMNTHNCVGSSQRLACAHWLGKGDGGCCQSCICIVAMLSTGSSEAQKERWCS